MWIEHGFWVVLVLLGVCLALPALGYLLGWRGNR